MLDGTPESAAEAIAAAREHTPPTPAEPVEATTQPSDRGDDGRFKPRATEETKPATEATDDKNQQEPADDEEDYLELEHEDPETKEKRSERYKVSEVLEGYQRAKTLEQELAQAKKAAPMPEHYEAELEQMVQTRTQYADALRQWAQFNPLQPPNEDLTNPASPNYNPEAYWQQVQQYRADLQRHQQVKAEYEREAQLINEQQSALQKSRLTREFQKVNQLWPELKDKTVATKVAEDLSKHYGIDDATLKSVSDSRFYALAKDALAYRAAQAAKQEAVRQVTAKPKLVRAGARAQTDSKTAARQSAFGALEKSHSLEDAAAAIAALR